MFLTGTIPLILIGDPSKEQVILLAVGSFSPITFMHLRLFGMYLTWPYIED